MRLRAITDRAEQEEIIRQCPFCHMAMVEAAGKPYVIPMNFGYRDGTIYLHGSQHGKKIDILRQNPDVCINFTTDTLLRYQSEQVACSWSMKYRSVLCYGTVEFVTDPKEKVRCLDIIMSQYIQREFKYNPPSVREVNVFKVRISRFEGRAFGN
jgi:uncharacterized protein